VVGAAPTRSPSVSGSASAAVVIAALAVITGGGAALPLPAAHLSLDDESTSGRGLHRSQNWHDWAGIGPKPRRGSRAREVVRS